MKSLGRASAVLVATFVGPCALAVTPAPWTSLVPETFRLVETIHGDLNRDGQSDVVLLVKATDPAGMVTDSSGQPLDRNRRGLVIGLRVGNTYRLALSNLSLLSSENEDGGIYFAPELALQIEKNVLVLHYAHGRYGFWRYKFRHEQGQFVLIGYDREASRGPVVQSFTSVNVSTGRKLKRVNVNGELDAGEERFVERWSPIVVPKPIRLAEIADLEDGSIEQALGER